MFQILEIHLVISVCAAFERIEHHLAPIGLGRKAERMIDGWLDNHLFAGLGKDVENETDAFHNARNKAEPLALHVPVVVRFDPVDHGRPIVFRFDGIAKDGMFHPFL